MVLCIWKHKVTPEEIDELLFSKPSYCKVQKGHIPAKDVYSALVRTGVGGYLVVFFVYKQTRRALILSAWDMDQKERKQYGYK